MCIGAVLWCSDPRWKAGTRPTRRPRGQPLASATEVALRPHGPEAACNLTPIFVRWSSSDQEGRRGSSRLSARRVQLPQAASAGPTEGTARRRVAGSWSRGSFGDNTAEFGGTGSPATTTTRAWGITMAKQPDGDQPVLPADFFKNSPWRLSDLNDLQKIGEGK